MTATQTPDLSAAQLAEVATTRQLLEGLLAQERYEILQVVVGDFDRRESVLLDSPGTRAKRLLIPRFGQGNSNLAVPATITEICEQDEGRLGGLIVNTGTFPIRLYFTIPGKLGGVGAAAPAQAPHACTTLNAAGGSFDFRLGNVLYGGTVCAHGVGGASTLDWGTF